jgi:predicted dinucleotide-binding enzyme
MSTTDGVERIGVIGAGRAGQAVAHTALRAGRGVVIANRGGPTSLGPVVADLGPGVVAGTVGDAAACPIAALAVPWANVPSAVGGLTWNGAIVIDVTNALLFPDLRPAPSATAHPARSSPNSYPAQGS